VEFAYNIVEISEKELGKKQQAPRKPSDEGIYS
jgi:hypothetical protein